MTCELYANRNLNQSEIETKVNEIYFEYKLPVGNDELMVKILQKYENDPEVIEIIKKGAIPCAKGEAPNYYN